MESKATFFNAIESGGVYDRIYNAEDVTSYLDKIVGNGVFPTPSTQLKVTAGTGLQVTVAAGQGWIDGHKLINTAALSIFRLMRQTCFSTGLTALSFMRIIPQDRWASRS